MVHSKALTRAISVALLAVLLAGCPKSQTGYGITCPPLENYSNAFLARVADQIDAIEKIAPDVVTMVNDYGVTRESIRVCIKLQMAKRTKKN